MKRNVGRRRGLAAARFLVASGFVAVMIMLVGARAGAAPADDFVITVRTDISGPSADTDFTIPTSPFYTYDYDVDWGDSSTDTGLTGDSTHVYEAPGTYTIRISGLFPAIQFNGEGDKDKILTVDQWGTNNWRSMAAAFSGASNLTLSATDSPDLSRVSSLASAFQNAPLVNSNLDRWDVSNVSSFAGTFEGATAFDLDIGGWDVSSATNMRSMFRGTAFNQDISGWHVSNVTSMSSMFFDNTEFDQPIGSWGADTGNVTTFSNMFRGASSFNQPLAAWDTGSATTMKSMFRAAATFNQDIGGWDVAKVTAMSQMFMLASEFDQDISGWDVSSSTDMSFMFRESKFNQPIGVWGAKTSNVTSLKAAFQQSPFNQDVSGWDTSSVTDMSATFRNAPDFDQDLSGWSLGQVAHFELFLNGSAIQAAKYDALLNALNSQSLQSGVNFGALGLTYCLGDAARTEIIATYGWTFEGDQIECPPTDPTLPPDLRARSDTGASDTDNATAQNTPTFDVECTVAGAMIVLFSDNPAPRTPIGSHLCYEAGIEPVTAAPALPDGAHAISYLNENGNGQSAISPALAISIDASTAVFNPIELENKKPGTDGWKLATPADDLAKQIKGYGSKTSVNLGESIDFHVSVDSAQDFIIDLYRMGWYQGWGGRLIGTIGPLAGSPQTYTAPDPVTGIIEYDWPASHTLNVPTTWTSGVYLAKLTNADGFQNYISFVVRDDDREAALLYQQSATTDQAYNNFPDVNPNNPAYDPDDPTHQGKSFYDGKSRGANTIAGTTRAVKISLNRPFARDGSGLFFNWEHDQIQWLERLGYDLSYSSNLDTHRNGANVSNYQGFLSSGHDEYWTKEMFDAVEAARDRGVSLAFFGANAVYSQIRFEPAADGTPNRTLVSYRNNALDPEPVLELKTNRFRELGRAEQSLVGVMYDGFNGDFTKNTAFVPQNLDHWIYDGTGFVLGDSVPGIVGYEYDLSNPGYSLPANQSYAVLSSSPFVDNNSDTVLANAAVYQAPSGAWVFGSGTMSWSWGLNRHGLADARIQRMTENFLDRVLERDAPIAPPAPDLQPGSDTGPSDTDDDTTDTTPSFDVDCAMAGNTMTLYSDIPAVGTVIGAHQCLGIGRETLEVSSAVAVGVHNFTLTQTGPEGESEASPRLTVIISEEPVAGVPPGAVLALEGDSGVVTNNAGVVLRWTDQSASGNTLTARAGNPTVGTSPSGEPVVVFDGVTDRLRKIGRLTSMPLGSANRSVFVVAENRESGWGGFGWGVRGNNRTFGVGIAPTGNYAVQGWGAPNSFDSDQNAVGNGWAVQSVTLENNDLTHYLDGVEIGSLTHTFNTARNLIVVGSEIDGRPQLDMSVAAVYVYDRALTTAERQQLDAYLTGKYLDIGPDETPPVIETGQSFSVSSEAADGDVLGSVLATDDVGVVDFQIVDGDPTSVFTIDALGELSIADRSQLVEGEQYTLTIQASDVVPNSSTQTITVGVTGPSLIPPGAVLVLEADEGVVLNTPGVVLSWADQSGLGNDLTARSGDPRVGTSPSGSPAIVFDGRVDRLRKIGGVSGLPTGSSDRSVFVVAEHRESRWGGVGWGVRGNNRTFGVGVTNQGSYGIQGFGTANSFDSGVAAVDQGWAVQSVTLDDDQLTHFVDGVVVDSQTHTFNTASNLIVVGAEIDSNPQLDMSVAAVYVYDRALSTAEHQQLEAYLTSKYLGDLNL